ncbi:MAG: hypothetical protein HYX76_01195 [Acidobacteria bacterium]|nr:hypothetical protein [Acidobacteriota bacterium]
MEILVIAMAVVLFGGMFLALFLSYDEMERERTKAAIAADMLTATSFYGWRARYAAVAEELLRRQIEHHVRREALFVERFINDPSPQTLRAGTHLRLGVS